VTENQIGHRSEVKQALDLLVEVAKQQPRVRREPEPTAHVINLADPVESKFPFHNGRLG
jgi:small-conductance mechanosensitive channel